VEVFPPARDYALGVASEKRREITPKPARHYKERDQALEQINEANARTHRRLPEETDPQTENKNQIGGEIAEGVETPASFRIEILAACNLAVARVQDIDQLEQRNPGHEPGVVAAHLTSQRDESVREVQYRP